MPSSVLCSYLYAWWQFPTCLNFDEFRDMALLRKRFSTVFLLFLVFGQIPRVDIAIRSSSGRRIIKESVKIYKDEFLLRNWNFWCSLSIYTINFAYTFIFLLCTFIAVRFIAFHWPIAHGIRLISHRCLPGDSEIKKNLCLCSTCISFPVYFYIVTHSCDQCLELKTVVVQLIPINDK